MTMPVLLPPPTAELAQPYLTASCFKAFPAWLDLDNLIPGGVQALQDDELADVLLTASRWAVTNCDEMPLHGHYVQNETIRTRARRDGRITLKPWDVPCRGIVSLSYGWDPAAMTPLTLPDPTIWNERGRLISFRPGGAAALFTGTVLQFGAPVQPMGEVWVQWSYPAGFPATTLAANCAANASSITVTDPTSILPGDVLRIYDNGTSQSSTGANEAVTVAATYAPAIPAVPPVPTVIPLAGSGTAFAHTAGTAPGTSLTVTGMPRTLMQAVIAYSVALLMRDDVTEEAPAGSFGAASRAVASGGGKAGGLVNDALEWLAPFRPTLRS